MEDPGLVGCKVPHYIQPVLSEYEEEKFRDLNSFYSYYKLFQSDHFVNEIVHQSRLYAAQKSMFNAIDLVTSDTVRCIEALLLRSGYNPVPQRKMIWELKKDCHMPFIANSIRRDEADAVLKALHFNDNLVMTDDPFYKVNLDFELDMYHFNVQDKNNFINPLLQVRSGSVEKITGYYKYCYSFRNCGVQICHVRSGSK